MVKTVFDQGTFASGRPFKRATEVTGKIKSKLGTRPASNGSKTKTPVRYGDKICPVTVTIGNI